jgi:hypothetical protein
MAELLQPCADRRGAPVLPYDRVVKRPSGRAIPDQRRFALIGDPDADDPARRDIGFGQRPTAIGLEFSSNTIARVEVVP